MRKMIALLSIFCLLLTACSDGNHAEPGEELGSSSLSLSQPSSGESSAEPSEALGSESSASSPLPAEAVVDHDWQFASPEEHGLDAEVFADMHEALVGTDIHSVVTVKDGVIVDEYYAEGYDADSLFEIYSASKSYTGALIGIALEEGMIGDIDDPIADYLPQVLEEEDVRKQQITIRHLLTHTSGLEWYEWGGGYSNWTEFRSADNWLDYILGRDLVSEPGSTFNYSTGNTHLLSAILEAATGMTQEEYCRIHLFDPMGVSEDAHWYTDPQGITDGGNGLSISARDAAKFGQLFLDGGVWKGEQLVPADWVEASTTRQNNGAGDATGAYGYQWWMRSFTTGSYNTYVTPYPTESYEVYFAFGHAGQFIHVVPALDMVVVFTSSCQNAYLPRHYLADYILNAYRGEEG